MIEEASMKFRQEREKYAKEADEELDAEIRNLFAGFGIDPKFHPSRGVFFLGGFSIFMVSLWKFATIVVDYGIMSQ